MYKFIFRNLKVVQNVAYIHYLVLFLIVLKPSCFILGPRQDCSKLCTKSIIYL